MMSEQKDNQVLEEYLKGDSDLSRRFRAESKVEPPAHLDAAIVSAAKNALNNDKAGAGPSTTRWYVPLSLAAVIVISFGVVFKIHEQDGQQTIVKQPEMKKEQPAMMEEHPESATAPSAIIMRDESFISDEMRIETDSASATRAAPAAGEAVSKDDSLSGIEVDPPAAQSVESLSMPTERRIQKSKQEMAEDITVTGNALQPQQWFEIINQLWFDGDEEGAYSALNKFLEIYPDYPPEELKKQIPVNMDLSLINPG